MTLLAPYVSAMVLVAAGVLLRRDLVPARSVVLFGVLATVALFAAVDVQGRPKPVWTEWRGVDEIDVVATIYHPGEGIYVWARGAPPVVYELPWDAVMARQMQELERGGEGVILRRGDGQAEGDGVPGADSGPHPDAVPDDPEEIGAGDAPRQNDGGQTGDGEWSVHRRPVPFDPPKEVTG